MVRLQTPKSASSAPIPLHTTPLRHATTQPVTSAVFACEPFTRQKTAHTAEYVRTDSHPPWLLLTVSRHRPPLSSSPTTPRNVSRTTKTQTSPQPTVTLASSIRTKILSAIRFYFSDTTVLMGRVILLASAGQICTGTLRRRIRSACVTFAHGTSEYLPTNMSFSLRRNWISTCAMATTSPALRTRLVSRATRCALSVANASTTMISYMSIAA